MNEFPSNLNVEKKETFSDYNYERLLCLMRNEIYIHMLWRNENDSFDFDRFFKVNFNGKSLDMLEKMKKTVMEELNNIGWKTELSFGATSLFIYSSENKPPSCW